MTARLPKVQRVVPSPVLCEEATRCELCNGQPAYRRIGYYGDLHSWLTLCGDCADRIRTHSAHRKALTLRGALRAVDAGSGFSAREIALGGGLTEDDLDDALRKRSHSNTAKVVAEAD